jgi:DNA-binding NarL/FixJ family response regulator
MDHATETVATSDVRSILIVDDHPLYRDALESALDLMFTGADIRKSNTLGGALKAIETGFDPDLVMFDLKLPDVSGISGFCKLRAMVPDARILVISSLASVELVQSLMRQGASGFLPKDASAKKLKSVLEKIMAGETYVPEDFRVQDGRSGRETTEHLHPVLQDLTPQQQRIMKLICTGKPNKQIAYELSLAEATVKAHITALLRRLGARNRTQAVVMVEGSTAAQRGPEPEVRAFLNN